MRRDVHPQRDLFDRAVINTPPWPAQLKADSVQLLAQLMQAVVSAIAREERNDANNEEPTHEQDRR